MVTVVPRDGSASGPSGRGAVLYLHGGAFVHGIAVQHWRLVAELADRAVVTELDGAGQLHVVGDSAGGTLALLLAQMCAPRGDIAGLTLIAPLLDLTLDNPEMARVERIDPWLSRAGMMPSLRSWAGGRALDAPALSPLHGNLESLPPTLVLVGSRDICLPDCRRLRRDAPSSWDLTLHVEEGSPHVYPLLPTPEGRAARARLLQHIEQH